MTLTPNTQNTPSDILGQMREEMPFYLSERVNIYVIEAMKLYATQKVKEALRVAAERATLKIERDSKQILEGNYAYFADDLDHVEVDKQSILSLETELVENINKEK